MSFIIHSFDSYTFLSLSAWFVTVFYYFSLFLKDSFPSALCDDISICDHTWVMCLLVFLLIISFFFIDLPPCWPLPSWAFSRQKATLFPWPRWWDWARKCSRWVYCIALLRIRIPKPDPHFFGPPGSGSTSQRYGSGSGSGCGSWSGCFYHHAKIVRKALIPTIL